jgi:hypothetical protein
MHETITATLTPLEAKKIIKSLGESGLPPNQGVAFYNVGNESLLSTLEKEYFEDYLKDGGAAFKLVVGYYGSGKSHFLLCIRDLAWRHNFVVSRTELSPRECPYDDQLAVYKSVARNIIWHSEDKSVSDETGLPAFLENHFYRLCSKMGIDEVFEEAGINSKLNAWIENLKRARVESPSFLNAVRAYFRALALSDEEQRRLIGSYLLGESLGVTQIRSFDAYEKMDKSNAFRQLRSLCQIISELGYSGTVLLFDEGDRMISIGAPKREKIAIDNLREVVDRCANDQLPGTLFVYAVPPQFVNDIAPKYDAFYQRIGRLSDAFSRRNHFSPLIDLAHLDLPGLELLKKIGERILPVFELAYNCSFDSERQKQNISLLADECAQLLGENYRRVFVKTLVTFLNEQRIDGERNYDSRQAENHLQEVNETLNKSEANAEY